jgi:predicted porin
MKKSLLALAVLGSFAGAAAAQSNVTIYGVADVGISRFDTSATEPTWGVTSGQQSGSRLGFRGTEDLGGGLSAIFALENGYNIDTGTFAQSTATTTRLFGRQAWVGLKSNAGAVKLGRQYTPMHNAHNVADPFGTNLAGNIQGGVGTAMFNAGGIRMDNTINYSHSVAGFNGELAYGFGEAAGNFGSGSHLGASVGYANGPIAAVLAYDKTKTGSAPLETVFLGGTYDFGVAKAHLAFANNKAETAGGVDAGKSRDYMLGVSAPVGPAGTVLASYIRHDDRFGTAPVDADQYAIGYSHALSKRTNLYTSYGKLNSKPAGSPDATLFNAGIRHTF